MSGGSKGAMVCDFSPELSARIVAGVWRGFWRRYAADMLCFCIVSAVIMADFMV